MIKFTQLFDGEWVAPKEKGYHTCCCDCSLVHRLEFRVRNGKVEFRAWRNKRETEALRKRLRKKKQLGAGH